MENSAGLRPALPADSANSADSAGSGSWTVQDSVDSDSTLSMHSVGLCSGEALTTDSGEEQDSAGLPPARAPSAGKSQTLPVDNARECGLQLDTLTMDNVER